jgi:hypothetical protein
MTDALAQFREMGAIKSSLLVMGIDTRDNSVSQLLPTTKMRQLNEPNSTEKLAIETVRAPRCTFNHPVTYVNPVKSTRK